MNKKDKYYNRNNLVAKDFTPGPSVCFANGKYYMVSSYFQYFSGILLRESDDLVNWHPMGYVLTSKAQMVLQKKGSFSDVVSPTIHYNKGRFYIVTTNDTTHENFYVYTDDIYGEWSEAIRIEQKGTDPSLHFDGNHAYFLSNGTDDDGKKGVIQCEIDIATGKKLSKSKCIWKNSRSCLLENPQMYHIGSFYYLMAVEGDSEYGRKSIYAKSGSVWGPFTNDSANPVLINHKATPCPIQDIGHGDLIQSDKGDWYFMCLGFHREHIWSAYHVLGREVLQMPIIIPEDGWFTAEADCTLEIEYEFQCELCEKRKE